MLGELSVRSLKVICVSDKVLVRTLACYQFTYIKELVSRYLVAILVPFKSEMLVSTIPVNPSLCSHWPTVECWQAVDGLGKVTLFWQITAAAGAV